MLSAMFAFSWSKWLASPTLGRRQFVMRAAEWVDQGGAGTGRGGIWSCSIGGDDSITKGEGRDMDPLSIGLQ